MTVCSPSLALRWRPVADPVASVAAEKCNFPLMCLLILASLTTLGISGTSSNILQQYVEGPNGNPHVIAGKSEGIRSDEWLVNTPMTIAQYQDGMARTNKFIGSGEDTSVVFDVPYKDWSTVFRPQDWGFFVLPLTNAFALRWWLIASLLALSIYWCTLELLPERVVFAATLGLAGLFSPFVQWWFQSGTVLPLAGAFALVALTARLQRGGALHRRIIGSLGVAFVGGVFALGLYPPFQVPCALVAVGAASGLLANSIRDDGFRRAIKNAVPVIAGLGGAVAILGAFLLTRRSVVTVVSNTSYPGARVVPTGGGSLTQVLSGFVAQRLRDAGTVPAALGGNQSEGSTFLVIGLFTVLAQWWLMLRARKLGLPQDYLMLGLQLVGLVFALDLLQPGLPLLAHVTGLYLVPHARLQIGIGMLSLVLIIATAREMTRQAVTAPLWLIGSCTIFSLVVYIEAGRHLHADSPTYAGTTTSLAIFAAAAALLVALVVARPALGTLGLFLISAYMAGSVHPLYRGVFSVKDTPVGAAIDAATLRAPGSWVSVAGLLGNAVLEESKVHTLSADFSYPQFANWKLLDPSDKYRDVYNRYAHVLFTVTPQTPPLQNPSPDVVSAYFDACGKFAQQSVKHVLATNAIVSPCLGGQQKVNAGGSNFFLYDVLASS